MQLYNGMHPPVVPLHNTEPPEKAGENIDTLIRIVFIRQTHFFLPTKTNVTNTCRVTEGSFTVFRQISFHQIINV